MAETCSDCGFANPDGARFCAGCGKKQETLCPGCGIATDDAWAFCPSCGAGLKDKGAAAPEPPAPEPVAAPPEPQPAPPQATSSIDAERRQVTAVFCDMIGSAAMSEALELEDYRAMILKFQEVIIAQVERFSGTVAQFHGDGLVAYFGYPTAHEDAPERAVNASLACLAAIKDLKTPSGGAVAARISVATADVIVNNEHEHGDAATGKAPILAARLQELGSPNTVIIAESTRVLVRDLFEVAELGTFDLKGLEGTFRVWTVLGQSGAESRFAATRDGRLGPLIGRSHETAMLIDRWELVCDGDGQAALLAGEPGIGKSRLLKEVAQIIGEDIPRFTFQCSPQHTGSALYPFARHLELACGFARDDNAEDRIAKLEAFQSRLGADLEALMPLYLPVLGLPHTVQYPSPDMSPKQLMDRTIEAMCDQISGLADRRPTLIQFEDAHWIDPTSRILLDALIDRAQGRSLMILVTGRLDYQPEWISLPHASLHALHRLSRRECEQMIASMDTDKILTREATERIVAKCDGVPLYVEELTSTMLELGRSEGGDARGGHLAIPASLQDALIARLDRLPRGKTLVQIASVIGRDLHRDMLSELSGMDAETLEANLEELVDAGVLVRRSVAATGRYVFRHALVLDAAYQSMLTNARADLHAKVVARLESGPVDGEETRPEILAHHCVGARLIEKGTGYWLQAARRDAARSLLQEAHGQLTKGLDMIYTISDGGDHRMPEIEMLTMLGFMNRSLHGPSHPETEKAFTRALELCQEVQSDAHSFPAAVGLYTCNWSKANFVQAMAQAEKLSEIAAQESSKERRYVAQCARGMVAWHSGKNELARRDLAGTRELAEAVKGIEFASIYGTDFTVLSDRYLAMTAFSLGDYDTCRAGARAIVQEGRKSPAAVSKILSLASGVHIAILTRDHEELIEWADECIPLAGEYGFPTWHQFCALSRGWSRAHQGKPEAGLEEMLEAISKWRKNGNPVWRPLVRNMVAEVYLMLDQAQMALELTAKEIDEIERTGGRQFESLALVTRGRAQDALGETDEAEARFSEAVRAASEQGAKAWELRATAHLIELTRRQINQGDRSGRMILERSVFTDTEIEEMIRDTSRH